MSWIDRYMAIPFKHGGRDFSGCDCAGLYALIIAQEAKGRVAMPDADTKDNPDAVVSAVNLAIGCGDWRKIEGPPKAVAQKFDLVLMTGYVPDGRGGLTRADVHVGCATGVGTMIHTESGTGPRHVPLDAKEIVARMKSPQHGVYRPKFLDDLPA